MVYAKLALSIMPHHQRINFASVSDSQNLDPGSLRSKNNAIIPYSQFPITLKRLAKRFREALGFQDQLFLDRFFDLAAGGVG